MAPAVVHIHLHGDTNTVTQATAHLTALLRRANIDATPTRAGEIHARLPYPIDPTAKAELEFALHAWQSDWPDITADVAAR